MTQLDGIFFFPFPFPFFFEGIKRVKDHACTSFKKGPRSNL